MLSAAPSPAGAEVGPGAGVPSGSALVPVPSTAAPPSWRRCVIPITVIRSDQPDGPRACRAYSRMGATGGREAARHNLRHPTRRDGSRKSPQQLPSGIRQHCRPQSRQRSHRGPAINQDRLHRPRGKAGRTGGHRSEGMRDAHPLCPTPGEAPDPQRMAPVGLPGDFGGDAVRAWRRRPVAGYERAPGTGARVGGSVLS